MTRQRKHTRRSKYGKLFEAGRRIPTWETVKNTLQQMGWYQMSRSSDRIVFERGNERIIAHNVYGKWKTEYWQGTRMLDSTGMLDENMSKILTLEMGVTKRPMAERG